MRITLHPIPANQRVILENLFTYYVYDMSEFMGWDPNELGCYTFNAQTLDPYWQDADYFPYFIYVDEKIAGFALVRYYPCDRSKLDVEQFFVLRRYKGHGIGKKALAQVVKLHPGEWQIRVLKENTLALRFWMAAVHAVVGDEFALTSEIDIDLEMDFIRFSYE